MTELRDLFPAGPPRVPERDPDPVLEEAPVPGASPAQLVVMVAIVLLATIAAYLASNAKERVWGGRVELVLNTEEYDSESEFSRALATRREILRSEPVLGPAAKAAGMRTVDLQEALDVETAGGSEVLLITIGDRVPERAKALAQAVAENYLKRIAQAPADGAGVTTRFLRVQIDGLTKTLERTTARQRELEAARAGAGTPGAEESRLREEAADLVRRIEALRERVLGVEARRTTSSDVRMLTPARVLESPLEPKPKRAAVGGFLVGSLVAAGTAYLLRFLPSRRVDNVAARRLLTPR